MLPLQLLRVTTRKGAIRPLYCTEGEEVKLAAKIIKEVEESFRKEETRGQLEKRVASLNYDCGVAQGLAHTLGKKSATVADDREAGAAEGQAGSCIMASVAYLGVLRL